MRRDYVAHIRDSLSAARRAAVWNYDTALCLRPVRRLRGVAAPGFLSRRARGLFDLRCLRPARYSAGDCPPRVFRRAGARALPLKNHNRKECMMKLDINDSIEVKSRAEYRRLLRSWASQTGSRPVYEYDGPGVYRPDGWNDDRNCACCTLGRKN